MSIAQALDIELVILLISWSHNIVPISANIIQKNHPHCCEGARSQMKMCWETRKKSFSAKMYGVEHKQARQNTLLIEKKSHDQKRA